MRYRDTPNNQNKLAMRTTLHQFTTLAREIVDATNTEDNDRFDSFDNEKLRIHSTNHRQSKEVRFKSGDNWVRVYLFNDSNPILNSVQITFADTALNPCDFDKLYEDAVEYWETFKKSGHSILIDTQIKNTLRK